MGFPRFEPAPAAKDQSGLDQSAVHYGHNSDGRVCCESIRCQSPASPRKGEADNELKMKAEHLQKLVERQLVENTDGDGYKLLIKESWEGTFTGFKQRKEQLKLDRDDQEVASSAS